jgi:glycine betaine/proline transport system substrate-binding protein
MKKKIVLLMVFAMLCLAVFAGCGNANNGGENPGTNQEAKGKVTIGCVNWAEDIAMSNLAAAILEDKMGYDVEIKMADAAPIYTSLAAGNTDVFLDAWLPLTHQDYMEEYGDKLVDLGISYDNAVMGLTVPAYVDIDSVEDLKGKEAMFNKQIIGIDSGAGLMKAAEVAIQEYNLDMTLISGSGPTMTAALKKAIDANQPIVVTGWTPHWKFARWDLKILDDPKKVFGEEEKIHILSRIGFAEDMPEVAEFFSNMTFTTDQIGDLTGAIEESDKDPLEVAREWMNNNPDLINKWLPE